MKPPVIIGIATIEERRESLRDTLYSLYGQCDEVYLYQNGYTGFSIHDAPHDDFTCDLMVLGSEDGPDSFDMGDVGKFWGHMQDVNYPYYAIVCDDDLIYPPDYVETLIAGIERYDRGAVVGFHGKEYYGPVSSYYKSFVREVEDEQAFNYRCLDEVELLWDEDGNPADYDVTIIGTGCTGWHSSLFKDNPLTMEDFKWPNMADIWFSKKCNDLDIPRYVIPHAAGWIKHSEKVDMSRTIASTARDNDAIQTGVFNSVDWKL